MAKRRNTWNERKYWRYIAEGRGQGEGKEYKPWILIQDFSSNGMVSRVWGETAERVYHLLSNQELWFFYILDWSEKTEDIREQYPLSDIPLAMDIADSLGVRYPCDPVSGFPYVMTTDFLVKTNGKMVARSVKTEADLSKKRTREKLEIERLYWTTQGIDWKLVTEHEISRNKARNIEWIRSGLPAIEMFSERTELSECCSTLKEMFKDKGMDNILSQTRSIEEMYHLPPGGGISIFKELLKTREIIINLNERINVRG